MSIKQLILFLKLLIAGAVYASASASWGAAQCFETDENIEGQSLLKHLWAIDQHLDVVNSPKSNTTLAELLADSDHTFVPFSDLIERNRSAKTPNWFHFCLRNPTNKTHNLVFELGPPTLSEVDFYPQKKGLPFFNTGSAMPLKTRDIPRAGFDFKINLAAQETQQFYFRVAHSDNPLQQRFYTQKNKLPIIAKVWDRDSYDLSNDLQNRLFDVFVGIFLTLMVFNLVVYVLARQLTSLLYIIWSTCIFIALLSLNGRFVELFVPNFPELSNLAIQIVYPLVIFVSGLFFKQFLNLTNYPKLNLIGNIIIALTVPLFLLSYTHGQIVFKQVTDFLALTICGYFCIFVPAYTFIKDRQAVPKYVLISLAPVSISLLDRVLFNFQITNQFYVPYPIVTGAIIAMILISFYTGLMAYREKQAAQQAALEQLNISNTLKSNYNNQLKEELQQKTADIRSINADLESKAKKLMQMDESKSRFFANISHEFRTPLTLIEGPLTLLLENEDGSDKETIKNVIKHSNSLKSLIDQILLLSEIDEKLLELKAREQNMVQTVTEMASQFLSLAEQKGLTLSIKSRQSTINAFADVEKLQIVINNLLSNAIKFTDGPGQITVDVDSTIPSGDYKEEYDRDEYIKITISDTGSGIPEDELPFVFDRYFQSSSSQLSKSGVGTGIGLALVKELIDLHSGDISVNSVHDKEDDSRSGTQFIISLPLGRAHLSDDEIALDTIERESLQPPCSVDTKEGSDPIPIQIESGERLPKVLVVDDNRDMRNFIERLLSKNFNVFTAADGIEAENLLNQQKADVIVTDLMMPNRNGLEFVESIKRNPQLANIPVIMVSARAGLHDRLQGLMAAIDDYLIKPFNGSELKIRIRNLLNKQAQFEAFYASKNGRSETQDTKKTKPVNETFLTKAKKVVYKRLKEPEFGVDDLAKELHVSEATLRRRLAEEAKFTPAQLIRHCRLDTAQQLMKEGNIRTVAELSRRVGFSKPSYFSSLYKKTFNTKVELKSVANPKKTSETSL